MTQNLKRDLGRSLLAEHYAAVVNRDSKAKFWTAERVAALISEWNGGVIVFDIAKKLNCTRNAVIGKADRLGLRDRSDERAANTSIGSKRAWANPESHARRAAKLGSPEVTAKMSAARSRWWERRWQSLSEQSS